MRRHLSCTAQTRVISAKYNPKKVNLKKTSSTAQNESLGSLSKKIITIIKKYIAKSDFTAIPNFP